MGEENKKIEMSKVQCKIEELIKCVIEDEMNINNVDVLGKLIDMHKDLENEKYWKIKEEEIMRYRDNSYGRRRRDSRGRFRGEEPLDEVYNGYREYLDGKEEYSRGNYGAKNDTMKSLEYMLQSVVEFIEMLQKDANSQEEVELIREYTREISEM